MLHVSKSIIFLILFFLYFNPSTFTQASTVSLSLNSKNTFATVTYDDIINSTIANNETFFKKNILFVGIVYITHGLNILNCSVSFSSPEPGNLASGIVLSNFASLVVNNSFLSKNASTDFFFINATQNNKIHIYNSKFDNSPNLNTTVLNFTGSKSVYISNSSFVQSNKLFSFLYDYNVTITNSIFYNSSRDTFQTYSITFCNISQNTFLIDDQFQKPIFSFDTISNLFLLDNNFTNTFVDYVNIDTTSSNNSPNYLLSFSNIYALNFSNNIYLNFKYGSFFKNIVNCYLFNNSLANSTIGFFLDQPISKLNLIENTFNDSLNAIYINNFVSVYLVNCTLNSFFNVVNPIYINRINIDQKYTDGRVNGNYYSNFKSIDFNNDGLYDTSYSTLYFTDQQPLKFPGNNYFFLHGYIIVDSNYDESTLINPIPIHFFGFQWLLLGFFYFLICLVPLLLFLVKTRHNKKNLF